MLLRQIFVSPFVIARVGRLFSRYEYIMVYPQCPASGQLHYPENCLRFMLNFPAMFTQYYTEVSVRFVVYVTGAALCGARPPRYPHTTDTPWATVNLLDPRLRLR